MAFKRKITDQSFTVHNGPQHKGCLYQSKQTLLCKYASGKCQMVFKLALHIKMMLAVPIGNYIELNTEFSARWHFLLVVLDLHPCPVPLIMGCYLTES